MALAPEAEHVPHRGAIPIFLSFIDSLCRWLWHPLPVLLIRTPVDIDGRVDGADFELHPLNLVGEQVTLQFQLLDGFHQALFYCVLIHFQMPPFRCHIVAITNCLSWLNPTGTVEPSRGVKLRDGCASAG